MLAILLLLRVSGMAASAPPLQALPHVELNSSANSSATPLDGLNNASPRTSEEGAARTTPPFDWRTAPHEATVALMQP